MWVPSFHSGGVGMCAGVYVWHILKCSVIVWWSVKVCRAFASDGLFSLSPLSPPVLEPYLKNNDIQKVIFSNIVFIVLSSVLFALKSTEHTTNHHHHHHHRQRHKQQQQPQSQQRTSRHICECREGPSYFSHCFVFSTGIVLWVVERNFGAAVIATNRWTFSRVVGIFLLNHFIFFPPRSSLVVPFRALIALDVQCRELRTKAQTKFQTKAKRWKVSSNQLTAIILNW